MAVPQVRIDPLLYAEIKLLADRDRRSVTNYIEIVLAKHLKEAEK